MKRIFNWELCEVIIPVNATTTKFNLPDMPNLKGTYLWGLQIYTITQLPLAPVSGFALPTVAQVLQNSFITLVRNNGDEFLKTCPAVTFNSLAFDLSTSTNVRETEAKQFSGQDINWNKSYITFTAAPGGASALAYVIGINYSKSLPQGMKPEGSCPHAK